MNYLKYLLCKLAIKYPKTFSFPTYCLVVVKIFFTSRENRLINFKIFKTNVQNGLLVKELVLSKRFLILVSNISILGEEFRLELKCMEKTMLEDSSRSYVDYIKVQDIVANNNLDNLLAKLNIELDPIRRNEVLLRANRLINIFGFKLYY